MNHTQLRPTAMTNKSDPVINSSYYNRATRQYDTRKAYIGDSVELKFCYGGVYVELPDGRRGVTSSRYTRYTLVRMDDNGIAEQIPADTQVTVLDRLTGWGLPDRGQVVEVLKGERQGELGIVVVGGTNSTHVVFAEGTGVAPATPKYGTHFGKYPAKNLRIVNGQITSP